VPEGGVWGGPGTGGGCGRRLEGAALVAGGEAPLTLTLHVSPFKSTVGPPEVAAWVAAASLVGAFLFLEEPPRALGIPSNVALQRRVRR